MKTLQPAEAEGHEFVQMAGVASIVELRKMPADKVPAGFGSRAVDISLTDM